MSDPQTAPPARGGSAGLTLPAGAAPHAANGAAQTAPGDPAGSTGQADPAAPAPTRRHQGWRVLAFGALVALAVALLALGGPLVAVDRWWPLLLGAAIGFAPGGSIATRTVGLVGGLVVGWAAALAGAAWLPATPSGDAIASGVAVLTVAVASALLRGRVPLWTWLAGLAALAAARPDAAIGLAAPTFADVADAALGLATGLALAGIAAVIAARVDAARTPAPGAWAPWTPAAHTADPAPQAGAPRSAARPAQGSPVSPPARRAPHTPAAAQSPVAAPGDAPGDALGERPRGRRYARGGR